MSSDAQALEAALTKYVVGQLARFRAELESRTHQPVGAAQTDAALLLSDLCRHFGLDEEQHAHVLGEAGVRHVEKRYVQRNAQRYHPTDSADAGKSARLG